MCVCFFFFDSLSVLSEVERTVALYDPEVGRLLGTVDEASTVRRTSIPLIKDYFNAFLRTLGTVLSSVVTDSRDN